ncbi:hypothetical protein DL1_07140 [Thioclava dalianensis]|uniref:Uncharacterized protein n=1 Tax=Thioclava dalianensis TaxID=1185766 RepID=A0A074TII0_9RHOB|nr:hypothetical protein [Thioclava dalianensis]KEP71454.1 hypothetical protein DL1_07140 [Thioclava dalianensis]SFM78251.1 hypothetical protein SAMN05216224_101275 [Thioclava dalianensis]
MTRNSVYTALAAFILTAGTAGMASAGDQLGVIAPPMYAHSVAASDTVLGGTNQGKTQLAAQLQTFPGLRNINPANYTANELQNIVEAARVGNTSQVSYYVQHQDRLPGGPGVGGTNQGKSQLANQMKLQPTTYTMSQLGRADNSAMHSNLTDASYALTGNNAI